MIDCIQMVKKAIKTKNRDGDRITALLEDIIDEKYLMLRSKTGIKGYSAIEDIIFISKFRYQPLPSEVI